MTALYVLAALVTIPTGCALILGYVALVGVGLGKINDLERGAE